MIFFYVFKDPEGSDVRDKEGYVPIEILYSTKIAYDNKNIQLISWNEIRIGENEINNLDDLKNLILYTAKCDPVCQMMNKNAYEQYGIYLFKTEDMRTENCVDMDELINRTILEWANPMIGNLVNSPRTRPQFLNGQYTSNWTIENFIDERTLEKIKELKPISLPLKRSSRDQVRICLDVTTLARAITGEITCLATRKIEKIFALDLSQSKMLMKANRLLLELLLECLDFYDLTFIDKLGKLSNLQYISYFFPEYNLWSPDKKWAFFIEIVERTVGKDNLPGLTYGPFHYTYYLEIEDNLDYWKKIPHPAQSAIILNAFRCIMGEVKPIPNKYSTLLKEHEFIFTRAAASELPQLTHTKIKNAWSWNRDEKHESTCFYRENLLPLWGGASGHAARNSAFALKYIWGNVRIIEDVDVSVSAIVISSLFVFWRLLYDKRVSPVHTMVESFDTSIGISQPVRNINNRDTYLEPVSIKEYKIPSSVNEDIFITVCNLASNNKLIINSIYLMQMLKSHYYKKTGVPKTDYLNLKNLLKQKRDDLVNMGYVIPKWSQPIIQQPKLETLDAFKLALNKEILTNNIEATLYTNFNVKAYTKLHPEAHNLNCHKLQGPNPIPALYQRLKQQGDVITLDRDSLGSSEIPEVWKKTILTEKLTISGSQISDLTGNQFTLSGKMSVLSFGELSVGVRFSAEESGSLTVLIKADGTVTEFRLSQHYPDIPKTVNGAEVLSGSILRQLTGITIDSTGLAFSAVMDKDAAFWNYVDNIVSLPGSLKLDCKITAKGMPALFSARVNLDSDWALTDSLQVKLKSLVLESGLYAMDYIAPSFTFQCMLKQFILTVSMFVESDVMTLVGEFEDEGVFSLGDVLLLLGLPKNMDILPKDLTEEIFGNLGLSRIEMSVGRDPVKVQSMELVISAAKPWNILNEKITLKPFLCISIENPFDGENRRVNLQIDGIWQLGKSRIITSVLPAYGQVSASLMEGDKLDLPELAHSLAGDMAFPDISISKMRFDANYKNSSYKVLLDADGCLEFELCKAKMGITGIHLFLEYANKTLGKLELAGRFSIGKIEFHIEGNYSNDNDWEFSASGLSEQEVNFSQLWNEIKTDLPSLSGITDLVPSNFLSFKIGTLYAAYQTKTKKFQLYVVLNKIVITDSFMIESVLTDAVMGADGLESLQIRAGFRIADVALLLEVNKKEDGYFISGGTEAKQKIELGRLLGEFMDSVLKYHVNLPELLRSFIISEIKFNYTETTGKTGFAFACTAAFGESNTALEKIFSGQSTIQISAGKHDTQWKYGFKITCDMEVGVGQIINCTYLYDEMKQESQNQVSLSYKAKGTGDAITLADLLKGIGMNQIDDKWSFLTEIGISEAVMAYDFTKSQVKGQLTLKSGGILKVSVIMGEHFSYSIIAAPAKSIDLTSLPIAGSMTEKLLPSKDNFSVKDLTFYALSEPDGELNLPAGVGLNFTALGEKRKWQIYETEPQAQGWLESGAQEPKMLWLKIDKTLAIFTMHRIGLGLDGSNLMVVFDASLNVSPLTFRLYGAGVGVNISDFGLKFYITGFGILFKNDALTIGGELRIKNNTYAGSLVIKTKPFSIFAVAEYSEDGALFAYAVLSAKLGGPPAFFITGLALGFAYNKRIMIPNIEHIQDFPLIQGAMGKIEQKDMLGEISKVITDEKGEKFLAAGVKFTTFGIAESFLLAIVSFGSRFEVNLLGISDITMPPQCPEEVTPIAHAQLALKASVIPAQGFMGIEARLTPESYILSKDCHLTGGFAFYLWFSKEHSGDFVITLGGYHPKYKETKPSHYPDVPRLGLNWKIGDTVSILGEMYFALTPSAVMAGGRLCATYASGCVKAYFIAKVDLIMSWKPFSYDACIGVALGASVRARVLGVSFTLTLELGAELHIWGPDFSGRASINAGIVSFEIAFGANAGQGAKEISWKEFVTTFLPKENKAANAGELLCSEGAPASPLKIAFENGLNGKVTIDGTSYQSVSPNGVLLAIDSVMPVSSASINGRSVELSPVKTSVRPMGKAGEEFTSQLEVTVTDESGNSSGFAGTVVTKNLPTALWGGEGELVSNVPCGIALIPLKNTEKVFPVIHYISLEDLYRRGATIIKNAFEYGRPEKQADYSDQGTIKVFADTVNSDCVSAERERYLKALGIELNEKIVLNKYAANADSYLDEEVLIAIS